jgi:hypothetical protein
MLFLGIGIGLIIGGGLMYGAIMYDFAKNFNW